MRDSVFAGYVQPEGYDSGSYSPGTPRLEALKYTYIEREPAELAPTPPLAKSSAVDPCDAYLFHHFAPDHPEFARFARDPLSSSSESVSRRSLDMTDRMDRGSSTAVSSFRDWPYKHGCSPRTESRPDYEAAVYPYDAKVLGEKAAAAVRESETCSLLSEQVGEAHSSRARVDSAQEQVADVPKPSRSITFPSQSGPTSLLKVKTWTEIPLSIYSDAPVNSSNVNNRTTSPQQATSTSLPALHSSADGDAPSPRANRLPSLKHLAETGQLDKLAEVAIQQDPVAPPSFPRHHSQSFSSATSVSPLSPFYSHSISAQPSPCSATPYQFTARSPASTISEPHYASSIGMAPSTYYAHRRSSSFASHVPSGPPSLPSASSTGSNHTHTSSSTDDYSTQHTTPVQSCPLIDHPHRPTLPPPHGMVLAGYKCDWPSCNAPPFHTQYLLSSHRNVHSSNRPFFCAVSECSRGYGGKGFKRKNEMLRHGLVHNSPGYVCPFCQPEREHRYPRPDNLLRHVHVHHADKDRDDPLLTEVLARRSEGAGKARRRRTTVGSTGGGAARGSLGGDEMSGGESSSPERIRRAVEVGLASL